MTSFNGRPDCKHAWLEDKSTTASETNRRCAKCGLWEGTTLYAYREVAIEPRKAK